MIDAVPYPNANPALAQTAATHMITLNPDIKPRIYQQVIAAGASKKNSLVVLPTGLGKTLISLLIALHRLKLHPNSKILVLAPTRPLVNQHLETFQKMTSAQADEMVVFTGQTSPTDRADQYTNTRIIFSTPQGLENDILSSRIHLKDVSLLVFDEAHRATGDYSYVWVAKQYMKQATSPLILALTASPGTDKETIQEVITNLAIENVDYRELTSPDVAPYVQETKVEFVDLDLPEEFRDIHALLQKSYLHKMGQLKNAGFFQGKVASAVKKSELLGFTASLQKEMSQGQFTPESAVAISVAAQALKLSHAVELVETQGVASLNTYFKSMLAQAKARKSKAVVAVCDDPHVRLAIVKTKELVELEVEHPKLKKLQEIVNNTLKKNPDAKIIIFSQYRDTLKVIMDKVNEIPMADAKMFVGQAKKNGSGMSQKEQLSMIDEFSNGIFNVICMSSVGEEGLDIPTVDLVLFFEPIPSAIRTIQRKGRTGRNAEGSVIVLCTRGTRDVAYRWAAHYKEKNMYAILEDVKSGNKQKMLGDVGFEVASAKTSKPPEKVVASTATVATAVVNTTKIAPVIETIITLQSQSNASQSTESQSQIKIFADHREKGSDVLKTLFDMPLDLKLEQLAIGDYILSRDVVVEFKRIPDFVDSILDGRLLSQIKILKESVLKPIVIVEGDENLFGVRNIHPNAIYGMISTITVSYGVPLLFTRNAIDTANLLFMIARREQTTSGSSFSPHASNKPKSTHEQQEYIVSAIPDVGLALAQRLLERFGSVEGVVRASIAELSEIDGIGMQKAASIHAILTSLYR